MSSNRNNNDAGDTGDRRRSSLLRFMGMGNNNSEASTSSPDRNSTINNNGPRVERLASHYPIIHDIDDDDNDDDDDDGVFGMFHDPYPYDDDDDDGLFTVRRNRNDTIDRRNIGQRPRRPPTLQAVAVRIGGDHFMDAFANEAELNARDARVRFGVPLPPPPPPPMPGVAVAAAPVARAATTTATATTMPRAIPVVDAVSPPPRNFWFAGGDSTVVEAVPIPAAPVAAPGGVARRGAPGAATPARAFRGVRFGLDDNMFGAAAAVAAAEAVPSRPAVPQPAVARHAVAAAADLEIRNRAFEQRRMLMAERRMRHAARIRRHQHRHDYRAGGRVGFDMDDDDDDHMLDMMEEMELQMMEDEAEDRRGFMAFVNRGPDRGPNRDAPRRGLWGAPILGGQAARLLGLDRPLPRPNNNNLDAADELQNRLDAIRARARNPPEPVSSFLFDLIREDRTCTSVLSGWSTSSAGCNTVVQHCNDHPEEAFFVSSNGRPAIHEACLRGGCRHVIQALVAANPSAVFERDNQGNTALHLLFVDFSSALSGMHSNIYGRPKDMDQVVGDLLGATHLNVNNNNADNNNNGNRNLHAGSFLASATNRSGNTPLHMACMAPETIVDPNTIVQLLAACPSSASTVNSKTQTPLRLHCERRNASVEVARLLLLAANPRNVVDITPRIGANETFRRALEERNVNNPNNVLESEIGAPPRSLTQLDADGWAPIHYAAANGNVKLLRFLVEAYPEAARVRTSKQQTVLHLLCRQQQHNHHFLATASASASNNETPSLDGLLAAVDLLLSADPEAVMQRDVPHSYTPLHLICKQGGFGGVQRGGANRNGNAVGASSIQVVKRLLEVQPAVAALTDEEQYLPLHHACEVGCPNEIVEALLGANPQSAHAMTRKHDTALSLACMCNKSVDAVKLLINANQRALKQKNDYGFAPLHCVCRAYQPRMAIVQALVDANPSCVHLQTNAGETPVHLASSNSGAFVGILQLLASTQKIVKAPPSLKSPPSSGTPVRHHITNKVGNTPLHDACFRGSPFEHIETLAMANPEWISVHNNGGQSPLQILCKNGRLDERVVYTFSRIGGSEIFSVVDEHGNTPLHSAMREDTDVPALKCLVRALPNALHSKTVYGDTPLHLACFRRASSEIVREVAMSASSAQSSPMLEPNIAGQTPIGIAMEEFKTVCKPSSVITCSVSSDYRPEQMRVFQVLATLVKILYYGPTRCQNQDLKDLSLLRACVAIHRQGVRLDPTFIRRSIHMYPEEVKMMDEQGNFPLHIEAGIPIEKMPLLDGPQGGCCGGQCNARLGVLRILLEIYPDACKVSNKDGHFPLGLMIQNGRGWGHTIALALQAFPPALHLYKGLDGRILPMLFEKASRECGVETLYCLLASRPDLLFEDPTDSPE